ncbi:Frigida-like protein [Thalictrum thalictroides]|uniref:FRIGIDA-like protein n=1 Tax=Thalictrum thalictroides TaxID=46969 RepID=A0A7J6WRC1_THATH|nr:Frigida-like protein [Thalictrum thalictroides]
MATQVLDKDQVEKALNFFETQKSLLTNCTEQWKKLSTHFTSLEQSLAQKSKDLDSKLETLDSETKKTLESLEQRENSIPERETALIARVEEQKQAALLEFEKTVSGKVDLAETLKSLCRKMDSLELLRFITAKRKDAVTLRTQIALAIAEAVDSPRLVLDAVDDFIRNKDAKGGVSDRRWACGTLISALFPAEEKMLAIAGSIKERAAIVAEAWKTKIDSEEGGVRHVEAAMFLQMVVGFGIVSKFEQEFLQKLIMENPSRRDMPKLASALGFGEKIGDIIDELVKTGKEIDAVYFACECGLTERFPPVDLLTNNYKKSMEQAATILKNSDYSPTAKENAGNVELNSLKAIIKCVEDHKLESMFTLQNFKKRASQLEKFKADKRKSTSTSNKRTRGGGGGGSSAFRPTKFSRASDSYSSYGHRNPGPHHRSPAAGYSRSYNYPSQGVYKAPPSASYTSQYGAHSRSPAAHPQHYPLPPETMGAAGSQVAGSYGTQTSYGAYDYNSVAPSGYQPPYPQ